jgi:predicted nucleic acid-binding protein
MSKTDLRERPVYRRTLDRIKSHLIICFVSLLTLKETETVLRKIHYSLEKAPEILSEIGQGKIRIGNIILDIDSELSAEAQEVLKLFEGH